MESGGNPRRNRKDSADNTDVSATEIDDSLYSRQRYVLGEDAMLKLRKGKVAIFGLSGVGVETAKNLILGGCGHVSIWDPSEVSRFDLSQSYCFTEADVGQSRLSVAVPKLQELNPGCVVDELRTTEFDEVFMDRLRTTYDCVVANGLDISIERRMFINDFLRGELTSTSITSSPQSQSAATGVTGGSGRMPAISRQQSQQRAVQKAFISADVFGVLGHVFVDLGNEFIVKDPGNTDKREIFFSSITEDLPSTVTTVDRCSLTKGDFVTLHGVSTATVPNAARWNNQRFAIVGARDIKHQNDSSKTITQLELSNLEPFPAGIEATAYFRQSPKPLKVRYRPLRAQLTSPTMKQCEFVNSHAHVEDHIAWVALMTYNKRYGRWPEPWDREDCGRLATLAREQSQAFGIEPQIDRMFMKLTACTCKAQLAPLAGFIGGFAAQEAIKAITAKFVPLQQFLYVDFRDLVPKNAPVPSFRPKGDRYDGTRLILGDGALKKIFNFQAFLVGAGAIGCEWLKNLALVGFGTNAAGGGCITVTDDDHIEKSNLNRQFLFRPQHINKPKSTTAAEQVQKLINPGVRIKPYQKRVQPANAENQQDEQDAVFNDEFLSQQSAVLFALDNRNTRLYLAQRCCANSVAHFDSGTLGELGHTFTVLPFLTEKYDNVRDPSEAEEAGGSSIPYCTMKQFPYKLDHCIEWARDKFHTLWSEKPTIALRCLEKVSNSQQSTTTVGMLLDAVKLAGSNPFEGSVVLRQLLSRKFATAEDCVCGAREKFYKYFELKAKRLLKAFPPEHINDDGTAFWAAPKRAPEPAVFDAANPIHKLFIVSFARLLANEHNVPLSTSAGPNNAESDRFAEHSTTKSKNAASKQCFTWEFCYKVLASYKIKEEEDDDNNSKQKNGDATHAEGSDDEEIALPTEKSASNKKAASSSSSSKDNQVLIYILESGLESGRWQRDTPIHFTVQQFEKDDDSNGHMDFIYATTNARAQMYRIEQEDFLTVKRIAGRITPAIATTTACVAGLACLELLRFVHEQARINDSLLSKSAEETNAVLKNFRNAQLNLGDASLLLFEPNAAPRRKIFAGLEVNSWDTWRIVEPTTAGAAADGASAAAPIFTIDYVRAQLKQRYNIDLLSMIQGTRIIWMKDFPQFDSSDLRSKTDLSRMLQFNDKGYADVSIDCERPGEEDDGGGNPHNMPPELPLLRLEKASAAGAAAAAAAALKSAASNAGALSRPSSSSAGGGGSSGGSSGGVRSSAL